MGEEISGELEAKARDEAIKRMLKAWEEKPEEKRVSWGPIFGQGGAYRSVYSQRVRVFVDRGSTMDVTAHATGSGGYDEIVKLSPGEEELFDAGSNQKVNNVNIKGLGSGDQYAFGNWS